MKRSPISDTVWLRYEIVVRHVNRLFVIKSTTVPIVTATTFPVIARSGERGKKVEIDRDRHIVYKDLTCCRLPFTLRSVLDEALMARQSWYFLLICLSANNLQGILHHHEGKAMWRVIIRIGYFNDVGSRLRSRVVQFFNNMGLQNTATGTFESRAVPRAQASVQLISLLQAIANPQQFPEVDGICELKHLWMYIDRA
jgi:hypothetical protein